VVIGCVFFSGSGVYYQKGEGGLYARCVEEEGRNGNDLRGGEVFPLASFFYFICLLRPALCVSFFFFFLLSFSFVILGGGE
jgi:hypothetical protein